jgi:hypothetical protein
MKRLATKGSDLVSPNLRIREELRAKLEHEARTNQISINKEITKRLEKSFENDAVRSIEEAAAGLVRTLARVRKLVDAT